MLQHKSRRVPQNVLDSAGLGGAWPALLLSTRALCARQFSQFRCVTSLWQHGIKRVGG